jgi:cyanophycin synthetase
MNWPEIRVLRGANVWAPCRMLEVEVDLGGAAEDAGLVERALARLRAWLPDLEAPAPGEDAWAIALQRLAVVLQRRAGSPVSAGVVRPGSRPGTFRVAAEFEEEALGLAALGTARRLCLAALQGGEPDVVAELAALRDLAHEVRLGPSTAAIVAAARQQGIPALRLNDGNLVQLGYGARQRRIWTAETDRTGAVGEAIAQDKDLTRELLRGVGVPTPYGRPVRDLEDAWEAVGEVGPPVVVKPRHGNHGRGVSTNLTTREQVAEAFAAARQHGEVVVERYVPGRDFRLLVVGDRLAAAALREPPLVIGDGRSTVAELVTELNRDPRRSDGHSTSLSLIKLDAVALAVLAEQGVAPDSVPAEGRRVLIRRNANLSSGGTATDVTDEVHARTAAAAVAAARAVGLDIAGVDVVAPRIDRPLQESGGAVVEINAGPGLRMHLDPSAGKPRPVGEAIVRLLFPEGSSGRIPLAAVTGGGAIATARLLARMLAGADHVVGVACRDGVHVGGRQIACDGSGAQGARAALLNRGVTAAILEISEGGILREGLGFDHCDVAVVTGPGREDLAEAWRVVVRATSPGGAVLDAGDPLVAALASDCPGAVVCFARDANDAVAGHLARGGRAVLVRQGRIVLARGGTEETLLPPGDGVPDVEVESALAAVGAAWALGLPSATICAALAGCAASSASPSQGGETVPVVAGAGK